MKKNRWLILIAAIVINISLGAGYTWSVFQSALLDANENWIIGQTSLAFSISFAMVPIAMIIFGPMVDKTGPKKVVFISGVLFGLGMILTGLFAKSIPVLYITYGLILGLGIGAGYGTATATTVKWFPDKKGLAGGLTAAGFGTGSIILAPIATNMIEAFGVYNTFKIIGLILLFLITSMSILIEKPPTPKLKGKELTNKQANKDFKEMLKDGDFWLLWLVYIAAATAGMMIIGHAASIGINYSLGQGAFVVMIVGFANTFGRIIFGAVSDKLGRYKTVILMFLVSIVGLLLLNFTGLVGPLLGLIGIVFIALSFGGFLGSFPGITAENWGVKNAGTNYGWMFTAYGIAAIVGPSIAASLRKVSETIQVAGKTVNVYSYSTAFVISIIMSIVGILLTLYFMKSKKK